MQQLEETNLIARTWKRRAEDLAAWTARHLVNRIDVWGAYVAPSRRDSVGKRSWTAPPKARRGVVELTHPRLVAHFAAEDLGHVLGLHAVSPAGTCRWGAIDIDRHGGPNDPHPETTLEAARFWFELLVSLGFSPLLTDSNGAGGYHLRVCFDSPVPVARVYWFLRWVVNDYQSRGLHDRPETYPRAAELPPGGFGNWLRVPGRHHTNGDHWSTVWDGDGWLSGEPAINTVLAVAGDPWTLIPPAASPPSKNRELTRRAPVALPRDVDTALRRCEAYIAKLPDAISGQRGHDKTFHAACECYRFGLDESEARAVMERFNTSRTGGHPWSPRELDHKLAEAHKRVARDDQFGIRLRSGRGLGRGSAGAR